MRQSFTVSRPPQDVWNFFADIERVAPCLPGASLTRPPAGEHVEGKFSAKLGPITAIFSGEARITRDDARKRGVILGAGRDRFTGSRAAGEVEYAVLPVEGGAGTRVEITIRALLAGPLAQFGRSGIVDDMVARITETFAGNLEERLSGSASDDRQYNMGTQNPLPAGSLLRDVLLARLKAMVARLFGRSKP
jgi:carbon-monoxide dehydrogenase small subunit